MNDTTLNFLKEEYNYYTHVFKNFEEFLNAMKDDALICTCKKHYWKCCKKMCQCDIKN